MFSNDKGTLDIGSVIFYYKTLLYGLYSIIDCPLLGNVKNLIEIKLINDSVISMHNNITSETLFIAGMRKEK